MSKKRTADIPLHFPLKRERETTLIDDKEDDASLEDINSLLSMPLPSLSSSKYFIPHDSTDEFLRLTTMVRAVYFAYLQKCLISNYIVCCKEKYKDIPCDHLKKCADELELNAVRYSLQSTVYRQNMLKLIEDIKGHTSDGKAYKRLVMYLETPRNTVDIAVQTNNSLAELERLDNIQSICITSNCEELSVNKETAEEEDVEPKEEPDDTAEPLNCNKTASPTIHSTSFHEPAHAKANDIDDDCSTVVIGKDIAVKEELDDCELTQDSTAPTQTSQSFVQNEDDSQDSLLQHMEDMFCESDDSSDLMTLIEKHSGVTKANIDKEINKICEESEIFPLLNLDNANQSEHRSSKYLKIDPMTKNSNLKSLNPSPGKFSLSSYKKMKNKEANKVLEPETPESKEKKKINNIWFVERVHQVSKLKGLMTELSLRNYRKHGRIKDRFIELFGESDDEDMMPDSPICIEEHLTACKERIAPWIVTNLMPYYKKRRIKDRQLFKLAAKHLADMLIIENTFPEPECVSKYIDNYFKNKNVIRAKQDVYV